ncbi:hypothetical protein PENTCL1PPCAC_27865 [Pristionchus entomophagus]|uniref:Thioredoxin domain-containing protein n=1 Tax=Pristionchus entomophagus TaxID=358040 RepID=A0AAV5UGU6_9BILA|nr:hypothetical protein PENTCL1PPCAC_27865 [Pristionchus entomophagus]
MNLSRVEWILLTLLVAGCSGDSSDDDDTERILRSERNVVNRSDPNGVDAALSRTLNFITKKTEHGRVVLLTCNEYCPREKRLVPESVHDFNKQEEYEHSEYISYRYHFLKQPLPFMNETGPIKEPTVAFLIGKEVYLYPEPISDKKSLLEWLKELDGDGVIIPKTHEELDSYLSSPNCSDKFLIYSAHDKCQIPEWRNIARIVRLTMRIRTIYIHRPIRDHQMATVLFKRLSTMNELDCMMMTFIQLGYYSNPLIITTPAQMVNHLQSITTSDACIMMDNGLSATISSPLSDLQMEYFTGERKLFHLEQSTAYLIVGATSGVAVVALAISIFWGLNGNAFASSR